MNTKSKVLINAISEGNLSFLQKAIKPEYKIEQWFYSDDLYVKEGTGQQLNEIEFSNYCKINKDYTIVFLSVDNLTDEQLEKFKY